MENSNTPNDQNQSAQNINQQFNNQFGKNPIPNATAVLVLGIISIPTCFCWGIIGLVCGIIALVLSGKALTLYKANPDAYTTSSFNNLKAGRVCAIIGLCMSALYMIYVICVLAFFGAALTAMPWQNMH